MSYSFLHCADIHFGKSRNIEGYLERQCQAFDWIYDTARSNNIATVVIAGDIYEREILKDSEREALTSRLLKYDKEGFTTIIMNGNHDWMTETKLNIWDLLMLQDKGKFNNTFILTGDPQVKTVNNIRFVAIPNRGIRNGYKTQELTPIIDELCDDKSVLILHELMQGSVTDIGHKFENKGCEIISKANPLYTALGDIHKLQRLGYAQYYSGSPIQHDFGDKLPKGCLLVDLDNPDVPTLVESSHIKPFIVTDKIEEIYQDAFIAYVGSRTDLPLEKPENIIQIRDVYDKQEVVNYTKLRNVNLTDGLAEFLANEGLTKEEQEWGLNQINEIIENGEINIVY